MTKLIVGDLHLPRYFHNILVTKITIWWGHTGL